MEAKKNILIVDDDAEFASMVAQAVRDISSTYAVTVATDAQVAMAQVEQAHSSLHPFSLVITDVSMPGSSGLRLVESLTQIAPEVQAIAMTEFHSPELAARVQEFRVHAYVIKPIAPSEIRQIVREALASPPSEGHTLQPPGVLPDRQKVAIERQLASLRRRTSSMAALLIHTSGARLAVDCVEAGVDAGDLCQTLMDAQRMIASAMNQALDSDIPIQQSYYGTESYSICTYRLDDGLFIATIFGPEVREGQVWYAMREASAELEELLASTDPTVPAGRSSASDSWRNEIEQYFTGASAERARRRRGTRGSDTRATAVPLAGQPLPEPHTDNNPERVQVAPELARSSVDQVDRDLAANETSGKILTEHSGASESIDSEGVQNRELYTLDPSDEQLSLDDIDWKAETDRVATDLDWDRFVAEADQGFGGMSLEEAKKRGIIDDLE
jgi:CheY-like chemotaxis protein